MSPTSTQPAAPPTVRERLALDRDELTGRAHEFARGSRAEATWRVYEARWARFTAWCAERDETPRPADPLTVCRFLTDLAPHWRPATVADPAESVLGGQVLVRPGVRPTTVAGYLAAISVAHAGDAGGDGRPPALNPARHEMVLQVMSGIRRHPGVAPVRRRAALRPDDMATMLEPLQPEHRLADARDAALLLIGWKTGLRTDDLARLRLGDIVTSPEGLTVHLRRSKTDQSGGGEVRGITATSPADPLDVITAWTRWRAWLASHGLHTGPAWRGVDRYGRRPRATALTTRSLGTIIATRAAAAGLDGDIGGHSLRRGFATSALTGGANELAVQRHGRWRSADSMAGYMGCR